MTRTSNTSIQCPTTCTHYFLQVCRTQEKGNHRSVCRAHQPGHSHSADMEEGEHQGDNQEKTIFQTWKSHIDSVCGIKGQRSALCSSISNQAGQFIISDLKERFGRTYAWKQSVSLSKKGKPTAIELMETPVNILIISHFQDIVWGFKSATPNSASPGNCRSMQKHTAQVHSREPGKTAKLFCFWLAKLDLQLEQSLRPSSSVDSSAAQWCTIWGRGQRLALTIAKRC